jgi:hypothetical protein
MRIIGQAVISEQLHSRFRWANTKARIRVDMLFSQGAK